MGHVLFVSLDNHSFHNPLLSMGMGQDWSGIESRMGTELFARIEG